MLWLISIFILADNLNYYSSPGLLIKFQVKFITND